jgi:hypothetical protein
MDVVLLMLSGIVVGSLCWYYQTRCITGIISLSLPELNVEVDETSSVYRLWG